jgi:hypothetical protein
MLVPVFLVLVGAFVALSLSLLGARSSRFEVSSEGLRLRGDWYGRLIPASQLRTSQVRRIDLSNEPDLAPRSRTLGTALPGYRSGWFRLRNGDKALLYLTRSDRAVLVPTTEGYSVLVSPVDPDAFVAAVQGLGRGR